MKIAFMIIILSLSTLLSHGSDIIVKLRPVAQGLATQESIGDILNRYPNIQSQHVTIPGQSNRFMAQAGFLVLDTGNEDDNHNLAEELNHLSNIEYAEINHPVHLFSDRNDPLYEQQNYISQTHLRLLDNLEGIADVIVAVVDTGIDIQHPDLERQVYTNPNEVEDGIDNDGNGLVDDIHGYNFYGYIHHSGNPDATDRHGHGSHIAGIIGATQDNNIGVSGIATRIQLLPLNFLSPSGRGSQLDAAMAIYYAVDQGARIINCSWGYHQATQTLSNAIRYAESNGVIIVAAAGNSGTDRVEYPAGLSESIAVGAIDLDHDVTFFSSTGSHIDFVTFGTYLFNTTNQQRYDSKSGTSQSAAVVSGIIARIISAVPDISNAEVMSLLIESTLDIDKRGKDSTSGYGALHGQFISENVARLLSGSSDPENSENTESPSQQNQNSDDEEGISELFNFPNPIRGSQTKFSFESTFAGSGSIQVYTPTGTLLSEKSITVSNGSNLVTWEIIDTNGIQIPNGTYIYIVKAENDGDTVIATGKLAILN